MLFNSILFLIFFFFVYIIYWNIPDRVRRSFLIVVSVIFYAAWGLQREGFWGMRWTVHFLGMAGINYYFVMLLRKSSNAKMRQYILGGAIIFDLLNLGIFKYFSLLRKSLLDLGLDLPPEITDFSIFLPLAISFYTFQMIAYVTDVYRGVIDESHGLKKYLFFILFFPQLIAGPIMRSTDFMWQIDKPLIDRNRLYGGCWLILGGLCKKVLLADPMGGIVAPIFREPQTYSPSALLGAGMCFSLQVYCDFSGYTDIARGCARLLGYEIPENFRAPYFSMSARELWQRWHITLSSWMRDYIYFPLGGNRVTLWRRNFNIIVTFALGGLWHGADYTFLLWGTMWGVLLALESLFEKGFAWRTTRQTSKQMQQMQQMQQTSKQAVKQKSRIGKLIRIAIMFVLFSLGALMFRSQKVVYPDRVISSEGIMLEIFSGFARNWGDPAAREYSTAGGEPEQIREIFGSGIFNQRSLEPLDTVLFMFLGLIFFHWIQYRPELFQRYRKWDVPALIATAAIVGGILMPSLAVSGHQFIYFVF